MIDKSFEQGHNEVAQLCRYYATNRLAFHAPGVKEAHVRQNLIDPFFEALGWDVRNTTQIAPQYREVVPEDSLEVEGQQKAPDYSFRVGTLVKFYAEAKKCDIPIHTISEPAFQLRRYGWNAKIAFSVLTNFEELGVYDCTLRPYLHDKPSHARIQHYCFEEYPDRWRDIWDIFSRQAVWSGAFDQFAASKRKRGTSEVDAEFLKEIEGWREELAKNIALRNRDLSTEDLNAAVQRTIDRVVFLRMAEDRGMEPYEQLLRLSERPNLYERFMGELCRRADEKYNSGLFHFQKEPGISETPDRITPKLAVDDKVLKPIFQSLYFVHGSPYDFKIFPVEILGTVYERFLGKVVRLTAGHQAKVEDKPEVRKAGGVYYTPSYIVDYIVRESVGRRIEGKSPMQLAGLRNGRQPFRVLDMACGSGSFLLGAYRFLLDHCLKWYVENKPEKHSRAVYNGVRSGLWRLTIEEKKRILTTHIFGADIDPQAVEVSKLSLLLKVLESETDQSVDRQLRLFQERALPNLADNIKCGNSLIGPNYFTGKLIADPEEMKRVNPFDWNREFPDAMKAGGFDCILGNPPYIRIQTLKEWAPLEVEIYKELFGAGRTGNYDIFVIFLEQGLKLLNSHGRLGYICPHKFFNSKYGEPIRAIISDGKHLSHIVHFGDQQVFDGATTYTCLLFLDKSPSQGCQVVKVHDLDRWRSDGTGIQGKIPAGRITAAEWNFEVGQGKKLFERLAKMPVKLGDIANIFVGLQTSYDPVFLFKEIPSLKGKTVTVYSKILDESLPIETKLLKSVVRSGNIGRYFAEATATVLFPYQIRNGKAILISESVMRNEYPKAWAYLCQNKKLLADREHGKFKSTGWYQLYPKNLDLWEQPKILVPYMVTRLGAYYDTEHKYFVNVTTGGFGVTMASGACDLRYISGLLNSRLLDWMIKHLSTTFHGGYFAANKQFLARLPIRVLDLNDRNDKTRHDRVVLLVDSMQTLHKQLRTTKSSAEKEVLQRQIDTTDAEINRMVYALYGLTDDDMAIVEGDT
jgi:type I restriction-modification system DNA methylase subunit